MTANRPRPPIPDGVKFQVICRQLGVLGAARFPGERLSALVKRLLVVLAENLGGEKLHLDHDPPLRVRAYNPRIKNVAARYTPNANDANHLLYRTDVDHRFKTNTKGDGAQHPDRVLIKKARRQERGPKPKRTNWPKRKMQGGSAWPKRKFRYYGANATSGIRLAFAPNTGFFKASRIGKARLHLKSTTTTWASHTVKAPGSWFGMAATTTPSFSTAVRSRGCTHA